VEVLVGVESVEVPIEWFHRLHDFPAPVDVATPVAAADRFALTDP
jgi:hypothetical protein